MRARWTWVSAPSFVSPLPIEAASAALCFLVRRCRTTCRPDISAGMVEPPKPLQYLAMIDLRNVAGPDSVFPVGAGSLPRRKAFPFAERDEDTPSVGRLFDFSVGLA